MSQIVLYFLHSTSALSFHIDVILTLSIWLCPSTGGAFIELHMRPFVWRYFCVQIAQDIHILYPKTYAWDVLESVYLALNILDNTYCMHEAILQQYLLITPSRMISNILKQISISVCILTI